MATRVYLQHRKVRKMASKKSRTELQNSAKCLKVVGLNKGSSSKTKAVSFKAALIRTRGFKFDREEANA
jgi:hypothetical protein